MILKMVKPKILKTSLRLRVDGQEFRSFGLRSVPQDPSKSVELVDSTLGKITLTTDCVIEVIKKGNTAWEKVALDVLLQLIAADSHEL